VQNLRRRLFAIVSVLSLILCLATVGLWVRSYWVRDHWQWSSSSGLSLQLYSDPGRISVVVGFSREHRNRSTTWHYTSRTAQRALNRLRPALDQPGRALDRPFQALI